MKKRILLSLILILSFSTAAFAQVPSHWKSTAVINDTDDYITTGISLDIIPRESIVLGWRMTRIPGKNAELVVTIYDGPMTQWDEILDEAELEELTPGGLWFPRPKILDKQVYIHQGPGTIVTIYFE